MSPGQVTAMNDQPVRTEHPAPGVIHLILQAPERRNPINQVVLDALEQALFADAGAAVLSAVPGPAFSAGGDLGLNTSELERVSGRIYRLCRQLSESATVFVAAADGQAIGGGAHLFLAADLRVAGPNLHYCPALPDRELAAGMWLLPATVGRGRALDLLLSGRALGAPEALAWGIADRLAEDATAAAVELATRLCRIPERHRARVKRGVAECLSWGALAYEQSSFCPPTATANRAQR